MDSKYVRMTLYMISSKGDPLLLIPLEGRSETSPLHQRVHGQGRMTGLLQ